MKKLSLSGVDIDNKEKIDAYDKVLDFINSKRCYDGTVCVLYGLKGTGKKTVMKQIIADNADRLSFVWLETSKEDTMDDVYNALDEAVDNKVECVFIDEITKVPDFIDYAEMLCEYYAKEGIRIILSGTDSLTFCFAARESLYDKESPYNRVEFVETTDKHFVEHLVELGTKDINDYVCHGGPVKTGLTKEDHIVYDYQSARRYFDDAVAGNIYRSVQHLARYANHDSLFDVTQTEMSVALKIMIWEYSGGVDKIYSAEKFAETINADDRVVHKFTEDMVEWLQIHLVSLGFSSVKSLDFGWIKL